MRTAGINLREMSQNDSSRHWHANVGGIVVQEKAPWQRIQSGQRRLRSCTRSNDLVIKTHLQLVSQPSNLPDWKLLPYRTIYLLNRPVYVGGKTSCPKRAFRQE